MPKRDRLQPLQVYRFLPRTNCKECGLSGCMPFAFALISREKTPQDCPPLLQPQFAEQLQFLTRAFGAGEVQESGLLIDRERCNGCGDCVVVCNRALGTMVYSGVVSQRGNSEEEKVSPVLQIVDGLVKVINWQGCKRCASPPNLCRVCEEKCPFGALELVR